MVNLSDKTALIYDWGLAPEIAKTLGSKFKKVLYYVPSGDAFPKSEKSLIGSGLEEYNVYRIQSFWDYVDNVDFIGFFDSYTWDTVEYLKSKGYPVFGPGFAEMLETDRMYGRDIQSAAGLPTQNTIPITGLDNLKEYLKDKENKYIKIDGFRGDIETFKFNNIDFEEVMFDHIAKVTGAHKNMVNFTIEDEVGGGNTIEPGYDGFVIDGKYPDKGIFAYELKGSGYIAKLMPYETIPEPVRKVNYGLAPFFKQNKTRSMFSTEVIVDKQGDGYLIDPTIRSAMPCTTAVELEMITNFQEIIYSAMLGDVIPVENKYNYGCGVALDSEWADESQLPVRIDKSIRQFVKMRRFMKQDGIEYALPGFSSILSVIGLGDTIEDAVSMLKENLKGVKGFQLDSDAGGLDKAVEEAKQGDSDFGMNFFK